VSTSAGSAGSAGSLDAAPARAVPWWAVVVPIVAVDLVTKLLAVEHLAPVHVPHPVIGDVVRFTLAYNPGAAFGMHVGELSRWVFLALTVVILAVLWRMHETTPANERALRLATATVMGGAVGNLIDRVRSERGVVDFIDIGIGETRFWTFNVADIAVSCGAVLLVALLWKKDAAENARARESASAAK
jgi:signal peptidase II